MAGAASDWLAKAWTASLVKGRCDQHTSTGWPDSVVCTAATKGILLGKVCKTESPRRGGFELGA
ncbi:MAG TPA: hypothetical protein PKB14_20445, partial [Rubrivivax sp.]|nr:hypothetical protein [Rubrivivax sp.]